MKKFLLTLISIIAISALIIFFFTSEIFNLKEISVVGNITISEDEVINKSGFKKDRNIFIQRYFSVRQRLKEISRIDNVTINVRLPDKIEIKIEEREEIYQISKPDGYYILDKQGFILRKVDSKQQLIDLRGINQDLEIGGRINEEYFKTLEEINTIYDTAASLNYDSLISYIEHKDIEIIIGFESEKKVAHIKNTKNIRTNMMFIKKILENEKGKSGDIYLRPDQSPYFREKL